MKNELDIVSIINPTAEDFTWNYNGEPYTILANETKSFVKPVAYHLAKHLSTKMIVENGMMGMSKEDEKNPHASIHFKIAQLEVNDTAERRVALYQIFGNENTVIDMIQTYPFKGFIGDMEMYKRFVDKDKRDKKEKSNTVV